MLGNLQNVIPFGSVFVKAQKGEDADAAKKTAIEVIQAHTDWDYLPAQKKEEGDTVTFEFQGLEDNVLKGKQTFADKFSTKNDAALTAKLEEKGLDVWC